MDVHEVLAVVVSGRQDSSGYHDKAQEIQTVSTAPVTIASAATPRSEPQAQSFGLSQIWSGRSSGSMFGTASMSRSSTLERHSINSDFARNSGEFPWERRFSGEYDMSSSLRPAASLPVGNVHKNNKLARTSVSGINRGLADFETMFHMDADRY